LTPWTSTTEASWAGATEKMIKSLLLFLPITLFLIIAAIRITRHFFDYKFLMPPFMGKFINSSWRKRLQPPDELIERAGIEEGMEVLEIGCGTGTYSVYAARIIGEQGRLYAVDIQQKMIDILEEKLRKEIDIKNIQSHVADACELPFSDRSFDLVFMVSVLPSIPSQQKALEDISRVLKDEGLFSVSEFLIDPDYPMRKTVTEKCKNAGFKLRDSHGGFFNYTLCFKKR
jgi:SAM-dependent methyltransferase